MIYYDQPSLLEELFEKDIPFTIQSLAIEMFKVSNNLDPTIIPDLFTRSYHHSYEA